MIKSKLGLQVLDLIAINNGVVEKPHKCGPTAHNIYYKEAGKE